MFAVPLTGRAGYIEIILWGSTEAKHLWHQLEMKHFLGPLGLQQSELIQISLRKRKGLGGGVSKSHNCNHMWQVSKLYLPLLF